MKIRKAVEWARKRRVHVERKLERYAAEYPADPLDMKPHWLRQEIAALDVIIAELEPKASDAR